MAHLSPSAIIDYYNAERRRHPAIFGEVRSSPQLGGGSAPTDEIFLRQLLLTAKGSRYVELEQRFNALKDRLTRLRSIQQGWDSYGAAAPNEVAIDATAFALDELRRLNVLPDDILPSAEGGVGICFLQNNRYAHIEFDNSGEVWALMYGPDGPASTWQLPHNDTQSLADAWDKISANIQP